MLKNLSCQFFPLSEIMFPDLSSLFVFCPRECHELMLLFLKFGLGLGFVSAPSAFYVKKCQRNNNNNSKKRVGQKVWENVAG